MAHWMELISDEVNWRSISNGCPGDGDLAAARQRWWSNLRRESKTGIHYTVDEFIAQGDRVFALSNCARKHNRTGRTVETPKADIIRMKDGKIVEFFEFFDSAQAVAASPQS